MAPGASTPCIPFLLREFVEKLFSETLFSGIYVLYGFEKCLSDFDAFFFEFFHVFEFYIFMQFFKSRCFVEIGFEKYFSDLEALFFEFLYVFEFCFLWSCLESIFRAVFSCVLYRSGFISA